MTQSKPIFWTVTGRDFGRSIAWARREPVNPVTAAMRAAAQKILNPTVNTKTMKNNTVTKITIRASCAGKHFSVPEHKASQKALINDLKIFYECARFLEDDAAMKAYIKKNAKALNRVRTTLTEMASAMGLGVLELHRLIVKDCNDAPSHDRASDN